MIVILWKFEIIIYMLIQYPIFLAMSQTELIYDYLWFQWYYDHWDRLMALI